MLVSGHKTNVVFRGYSIVDRSTMHLEIKVIERGMQEILWDNPEHNLDTASARKWGFVSYQED